MNIFRNKLSIALTALILVLFAVLLVLMAEWEGDNLNFSSDSAWKMADLVEYEGEFYQRRDDVDTLLIIGVDAFSNAPPSDSYNNDTCADFLVLMVIDHKLRTCSAIQVNRDTMTEVSILGIGGKRTGHVTQQISLSHTYGSGGDDSCRNTARAVSDLFGELPIDGYVCLTMDAVGVLNDLVGGVSVTMDEDLTAIDPAFIKGETVRLVSEQALAFVRHRSVLQDSSNAARMERQAKYLAAFYEAALAYVQENEGLPSESITSLSAYMHSDFSVSELEHLLETLSDYERGEICRVDGRFSVGDFVEFYPNEKAMKALAIRFFYEKNTD